MDDNKPARNLLLSFIKSRSKLFLFERYRHKSYKDSVNWEYISRFDYYLEDPIICSICLNEPLLPRMDKCGHIFCLSCLINFSKHENSEYILCPICKNYNINVQSTKRVTLAKNYKVNLNDILKFKLLVKGNNSLFPDYYHKLVSSQPNAPYSFEGQSNYSNISIDKDSAIIDIIESDIKILKKNHSFIKQLCGDDVVTSTETFLYNEKADFSVNISIDISTEEKVNKEKFTDCFNIMLGTNNQLERFIMFYQCTKGRFVLLEPWQNSKLIETSSSAIKISGKVKSFRSEKVTQTMIKETKLTHLPLGSTVTFVELQNIRKTCLPKRSFKTLLKNKKVIVTDKINLEKMIMESAAKKALLAEDGKIFTPMIGDCLVGNSKALNVSRISEDSFPPSFNLCMLGLSCDDPDDYYPHAKNCSAIKKENMLFSSEYEREKDIQSRMVKEVKHFSFNEIQNNEEEVKTHMKLNKIQSYIEKGDKIPTNKEVSNKSHQPPELTDKSLGTISCLKNYVVPEKKGSQREAKNLRKMKSKS